MEKYGNYRSQFLHAHTLMYILNMFPKPFHGFVVILVVVPDGSASVRIVNFSSVSQKFKLHSSLKHCRLNMCLKFLCTNFGMLIGN